MKLEAAPVPEPMKIHQQVTTAVTIFELEVNQEGAVSRSTLINGDPTLAERARSAFDDWHFNGVPASGPVPVTAIFLNKVKMHVPESTKAFNETLPDGYARNHHAPFPLRIVDPGYPSAGKGEGAVVLQLGLSSDGAVESVDTIVDGADLTPAAIAAAHHWTFFLPDKHARPQIAIAVIQFCLPRYESTLWDEPYVFEPAWPR